jgi:hypothetical protein
MKGFRLFPIFLAAVGSLALVIEHTPTQAGAEETLVGRNLGEALELTPEPTATSNCEGWFAEYADGAGYCLDSVITADTPGVDAWDLAQRISGHVPTDVERQIYELNVQIGALSDQGYDSDSPEMIALIDQLSALQAQQELASPSPTPSA